MHVGEICYFLTRSIDTVAAMTAPARRLALPLSVCVLACLLIAALAPSAMAKSRQTRGDSSADDTVLTAPAPAPTTSEPTASDPVPTTDTATTPATDPASTTEPAPEPAPETVAEPVVEPAAEPTTDPVTDSTTDPVVEPAVEPAPDAPAEEAYVAPDHAIWNELEGAEACEAAGLYALNEPEGAFIADAQEYIENYCQVATSGPLGEGDLATLLSVTSEASCSVTIVGTGLAAFEFINLDFDSLIQLPDSSYLSYLRVYQPGSELNWQTTQVSVDDVDGTVTVTITDPAICGRNMIVTTTLFGDNTGTGWYDPVLIQE
jgi:hypothetical protein